MTDYGRGARERREHDRLRYPGTDVLINKLNICDAVRLEQAERDLAAIALRAELLPPARAHSASGLKAIHKTLFRNVYDWTICFAA